MEIRFEMFRNRLLLFSNRPCLNKMEGYLMRTEVGRNNLRNREKWLETTLNSLSPGLKILDAGAGEQQYRKFCNHLKYFSQDFKKYNGIGDNRGLHSEEWKQENIDIISDIIKIPESDSSFDAIMCIEVFEHLPEPIKAIKEFSRLLKPNGLLILSAPFCSLTHMAPYHYYSGFNQYFYEKFLCDSGFIINECHANGNFFEYLAQEIRRIPSVALEYSNENSLTLLDRLGISLIIKTLNKLSIKNLKSEEILHFGYHIIAKKL